MPERLLRNLKVAATSFRKDGASQRGGTAGLSHRIRNILGPLTASGKKNPFHTGHDGVEPWSLCIKSIRRFLQSKQPPEEILSFSRLPPSCKDDQVGLSFKGLSYKGILTSATQ